MNGVGSDFHERRYRPEPNLRTVAKVHSDFPNALNYKHESKGNQLNPLTLSTHGKDPVPIVEEAGWAPGTVWTGGENLAHTGIRSPDRPARSQSLYRLSYQPHVNNNINEVNN
jgi:hypothetical protein